MHMMEYRPELTEGLRKLKDMVKCAWKIGEIIQETLISVVMLNFIGIMELQKLLFQLQDCINSTTTTTLFTSTDIIKFVKKQMDIHKFTKSKKSTSFSLSESTLLTTSNHAICEVCRGGCPIMAEEMEFIMLSTITGKSITLKNILYIPAVSVRLISVSGLSCNMDALIQFDNGNCQVVDRKGESVLATTMLIRQW